MKRNTLHKLLIALALLLSIALLACACGSTPDPVPTPDPETPEDPTPKLTYTVTVTDEASAPVSDATVRIFSGTAEKGTATTNASGVATLEVEEGLYTSVKVSKTGYVEQEANIPMDVKSVSVRLATDNNATYTITVEDFNGNRLAGVAVKMCIGELCRIPGVTNANGVSVQTWEKGDYKVEAILSGYYTEDQYHYFESGSTEMTITMIPNPGCEANPFRFENLENNSITVPAGKTVYYAGRVMGTTMTLLGTDVTVRHDGQDHTAVGGVVTIENCKGDIYAPSLFAITNNGTAEATYTVSFAHPVGSMENPAPLTIGSNSANTGSNGYFYTYTATEAGTLTITIDTGCADWSYTINVYPVGHDDDYEDEIEPAYGNTYTSADDTPVATQSVSVPANAVVEITIAAAAESATVPFTASFETNT
jgi:hypothetical protein